MNEFERPRAGWVEVITGCMYSGKTEELIKQVRRAQIAKQKVQLFKPRIDNRYSEDQVSSHNLRMLPASLVDEAWEILGQVQAETQVVAIDEAQFFSEEILRVTETIAGSGKRVLVAGLDTDWQGRPFGPMPELLAIAEVVLKQTAICMVCGGLANRTQRLVASDEGVLVGSNDIYEARCRKHFDPDLVQRLKTQLASKAANQSPKLEPMEQLSY